MTSVSWSTCRSGYVPINCTKLYNIIIQSIVEHDIPREGERVVSCRRNMSMLGQINCVNTGQFCSQKSYNFNMNWLHA